MPYFITDKAADCSGWATIKDDGEVIGCHQTKAEAIAQMVAVSIAEDMEPGGERVLPENYRPALALDVPDGRACGNCFFYDETNIQGDKAYCTRWDDYVNGAYYCNAWQPDVENDDDDFNDDNDVDNRQVRAPAPPSDQITGSDTNEPGSAAGGGGDIEVSEATRTALENKVTAHNDAMSAADRPSWTRARVGTLLAVYRRGSGAYSTSHRPGVSRAAWSMARVNAFLYLLRVGRPQNSAYITDNDLLPADHPRSTKRTAPAIVETRATPPNYMQEAAARGLELRREGFAGDGVTDATVREAREMADGNISDDKIIRAFAWSQRHAVDLRAPKNNDPNHPDWPGAGAVAHYLWGINPLNPQPAIRFLERESNRLQGRTTMSDLEIRTIDTEPLELRAAATGDGMTFTGYAAKYDSPSLPLPFVERIAPGAFTRSLKSRNDIKMFVNHSDLHVLASTRAKTLRLEDRPDGLFVEADLPDVTYANDLRVLIERGDVSTMSFGFSTVRDSWSDNGAERILNEVRLHEVSVVTSTAAYPATTASVRNLRLIARRTATDFDALTDAIAALELGELSDDQASLLRTVVDSAAGKLEEVPAEANVPMGILINKLDLIAKQLNI
jgi:HK97 family phage prohead protease